MFETVLAIIGVCLGFILTVIFLLEDKAVLIIVVWGVIRLVKWIWGVYKNRDKEGK
jgi:hypothetical protein